MQDTLPPPSTTPTIPPNTLQTPNGFPEDTTQDYTNKQDGITTPNGNTADVNHKYNQEITLKISTELPVAHQTDPGEIYVQIHDTGEITKGSELVHDCWVFNISH